MSDFRCLDTVCL